MVISISSPFLAAHILSNFSTISVQCICIYYSSVTILFQLQPLFLLHNSYSDTLYSLFCDDVLASFFNFIRVFNLSVYLRV